MNTWQDHPAIDLAMVRTLVNAVGFDAFDDMRGQFVDDLKSLVVAYKAACARSDPDEARAAAHALKGAAGNIGLVRLSMIASALEKDPTDPGRDLDIILDESIAHLLAAS